MSKDRMKRRERQTIEDIITPRKEKLRNSVEWRWSKTKRKIGKKKTHQRKVELRDEQ